MLHSIFVYIYTMYKYPLTRWRGKRWERQRGYDGWRGANTRRGQRERAQHSQRVPVFPHRRTDGRTGNPFRRPSPSPDDPRVHRLLGARSDPLVVLTHTVRPSLQQSAQHNRSKRTKRRPFVVKRYRSARGFKRLLYEYTRGDGGNINGVALSCRRRRVFARDYPSSSPGVSDGAATTDNIMYASHIVMLVSYLFIYLL